MFETVKSGGFSNQSIPEMGLVTSGGIIVLQLHFCWVFFGLLANFSRYPIFLISLKNLNSSHNMDTYCTGALISV
jgi:hypothetical protein